METKKIETGLKMVILRAVDDEPIIRYAGLRSDGVIMVMSERSYRDFMDKRRQPDWIGWRKEDVFEYNPYVFQELSLLFVSGNKNGLNKAWGKIKPFF